MIRKKMTDPVKETEPTNPNVQQELVSTLTQVIASSMEKMGTQLAQSLGQSLGQQHEEYYTMLSSIRNRRKENQRRQKNKRNKKNRREKELVLPEHSGFWKIS